MKLTEQYLLDNYNCPSHSECGKFIISTDGMNHEFAWNWGDIYWRYLSANGIFVEQRKIANRIAVFDAAGTVYIPLDSECENHPALQRIYANCNKIWKGN